MTDVIISDRAFAGEQRAVLSSLAALMIPADGDLPSAADPAIFPDVLARLEERVEVVAEGLSLIASICPDLAGDEVSGVQPEEWLEVVNRLRAECPAFVSLFEAAVAACYYQDDRVLRALGLPARAPYPEGNAVDPTDWSLLGPVRAREPFYRSV